MDKGLKRDKDEVAPSEARPNLEQPSHRNSEFLQDVVHVRDKEARRAENRDFLASAEPGRVRLPDERQAVTHKFSIAGQEGYITVGLYPNGKPGEIFISMAKEGSTVSGLMDSLATAVSIILQYGVPLKVLVNKFVHMRFEPSGATSNPKIPIAGSVIEYIFRWLDLEFGDKAESEGVNFSQLFVQIADSVSNLNRSFDSVLDTATSLADWLEQSQHENPEVCDGV